MRNEDGAKAGAKIVDYTTIIPRILTCYLYLVLLRLLKWVTDMYEYI